MSNTSAFPVLTYLQGRTDDENQHCYVAESEQGMTLRDYFAAKAMGCYVPEVLDPRDEDVSWRAKWAYRMADAMLAERDK